MKNIGQLLRISIYCYDLSTKFITLTAICHISESSVINLINILENPILHYLVTNLVSQPPLDHLAQGARTEDEHQVVDDAGPKGVAKHVDCRSEPVNRFNLFLIFSSPITTPD